MGMGIKYFYHITVLSLLIVATSINLYYYNIRLKHSDQKE
ncbi:hypothetical protein TH70_1552 [Streptococcus agalactiae]|nr:hypothetical protein TH70_1552 [Streptococcus agalactiae]